MKFRIIKTITPYPGYIVQGRLRWYQSWTDLYKRDSVEDCERMIGYAKILIAKEEETKRIDRKRKRVYIVIRET